MTRKHYKAIAEILNDANKAYNRNPKVNPIVAAVGEMADYFQKENGNFDRSRFLEACYKVI